MLTRHTKYLKTQRSKIKPFFSRQNTSKKVDVFFNESFRLVSQGSCFVSNAQYTTTYIKIISYAKKQSVTQAVLFKKLAIAKAFTHKNGGRLGQGKGSVASFSAPVLFGTVLFEMNSVSFRFAHNCFSKVKNKLPIKTRVIVNKKPLRPC